MNEERFLAVMRAMAWDRAKGELRSMLQTYYNSQQRFATLDKAVEDFIKEVEDNGWQE